MLMDGYGSMRHPAVPCKSQQPGFGLWIDCLRHTLIRAYPIPDDCTLESSTVEYSGMKVSDGMDRGSRCQSFLLFSASYLPN